MDPKFIIVAEQQRPIQAGGWHHGTTSYTLACSWNVPDPGLLTCSDGRTEKYRVHLGTWSGLRWCPRGYRDLMIGLQTGTMNSELEASAMSKEPSRTGHPQEAPAQSTQHKIWSSTLPCRPVRSQKKVCNKTYSCFHKNTCQIQISGLLLLSRLLFCCELKSTSWTSMLNYDLYVVVGICPYPNIWMAWWNG